MINYPDNFNSAACDNAFGGDDETEAEYEIKEARSLAMLIEAGWLPIFKGHTDLGSKIEDFVADIRVECDQIEEQGL